MLKVSVCHFFFNILQENCSSSVMQPPGAHLRSAVQDKQSCSSETEIVLENNPSYPATMKNASDKQDAARALTVTRSVTCSLLHKLYDGSLYTDTAVPDKDGNLNSSENKNSGFYKHRYSSLTNNSESFSNVKQVKSSEFSSYGLKTGKKPNDKEPEVVSMMGLAPTTNLLDSGSSLNAKNREMRVEKILSELASWRQKQSDIQAVQNDNKVHIPNKKKGRTDSKKWHQNVAASDTLTNLSPKHCDSLSRKQEVRDTSNSCSLGSHCK